MRVIFPRQLLGPLLKRFALLSIVLHAAFYVVTLSGFGLIAGNGTSWVIQYGCGVALVGTWDPAAYEDMRGFKAGWIFGTIAHAAPEWKRLAIYPSIERENWNGSAGYFGVSLPLWMPLLIHGLFGMWLLRCFRDPAFGFCPCGYNLTGNQSGVCPECGTAVHKSLESMRKAG